MRAGLVGWIAGAMVLAGGARADGTCAAAPLIAEMAGAIIEGRADLPGLHQRRFGAEAVYLALHYGGMEEAAARDLLATLAAENVTDARDVLAVLVMAREGVEAGLAVIDPDPARAFAETSVAVRRAVLVADGGESYFRLMREAEARPELAEMVGQFLAGGGEMVTLTAGMDDAALAQIVALAEAEGRVLLAIKLAAGLRDLSTFQRLMRDHATCRRWRSSRPSAGWRRMCFRCAMAPGLCHGLTRRCRPSAGRGMRGCTRCSARRGRAGRSSSC